VTPHHPRLYTRDRLFVVYSSYMRAEYKIRKKNTLSQSGLPTSETGNQMDDMYIILDITLEFTRGKERQFVEV
jgi:hypothetical protein